VEGNTSNYVVVLFTFTIRFVLVLRNTIIKGLQMKIKSILNKHNKYMMLASVFGGLLLMSNHIHAIEWTTIKKTEDYELFVDMDSYNESQGLPFITAKYAFYKPKNLVVGNTKIVFIEEHATSQFNCKLKSYKTLETNFYKSKGVLVRFLKGDDSFKPIMKNYDNATIASLVCQVHQMLGGL
jgi:hypothetical protein